MNVIELKNVKKNYPLGATTVHALRGVDLTIREGDFISIVGPSGSGKTTLLNIIGCIDHASEGLVKIHEEDVTTYTDRLAHRPSPPHHRVHLPDLQPDPRADHPGERGVPAAPDEGRPFAERDPRAGGEAHRGGGADGADQPQALRAVRGTEAAGGNCAGAGDAAHHRAGGRAHGQPGLRDRGDDPEADEGAEQDRERPPSSSPPTTRTS